MTAFAIVAWSPAQTPDIIRTKGLVIVDDAGRERIVMGHRFASPAGARIAPATGMIIRDTTGMERFGVSLTPAGNMGMGFDAPRGKGDDRNRERINIVADANGLAFIRFLDRQTIPRAYITLDSANKVALQLTGETDTERLFRSVTVFRDTTYRSPRGRGQ